MKTLLQNHYLSAILIFSLILLFACQPDVKETPESQEEVKPLSFQSRMIINDAKHFWAHTPAEVSGDNLVDLVFIYSNSSGGYLGYYEGQLDSGLWKKHIIAETPPTGGLFASGDLEVSDIDGDGDNDVIGVKHPGEWMDAGAVAELFWYENTGSEEWKAHTIGQVPDAVKDVSFEDFDKDGNKDLAILTFDEHTLSIFKQISADEWERVQFITNEVLHEGMAVGDLNGDGFSDIVATGMIYYNPGEDLTQAWAVENLDEKWNNQTGDWSRNGTKTFIEDLDKDGTPEIFMAHSERAGYPLEYYKKENDTWQGKVISDSIAACHTLQIYDFDLDGDLDVLAGVNYGRAVNLDKKAFDITVFINEGDEWQPMVIGTEGIYNGQAIDFEQDGDVDIFRYPHHEATELFLLENGVR